MDAKRRLSSRGAVFLFLLFVGLAFPGHPIVLHGAQAIPTPDLERALRANDLAKARQLVPVSWAAAEQLFVSYLERAFLAGPNLDARTQAARLAEVFFRIVEYDFARSVVSTLDTADPVRRQQLIAAVRDYFSALERLRASYLPFDKTSAEARAATEARRLVATSLRDVADRFGALSFPRGRLHTLRSMLNLSLSLPQFPASEMADKLADQLGDELSLVRKRPYTAASLAMAERLGLPALQCRILEELRPEPNDPAPAERTAKYLERARVLWRGVPPVETVNYWLLPFEAPHNALATLPGLYAVYHRLQRLADAQRVLAEAIEVSRPFGERALIAALGAFANRVTGLDWDAVARVLEASRKLGERIEAAAISALTMPVARLDSEAMTRLLEASRPLGSKVELTTVRGLVSGKVSLARTDVPETLMTRTLALALAVADPHEQAVTLQWYARTRLSSLDRAATRGDRALRDEALLFPPAYGRLRELCVRSEEMELTADALAAEGEVHARFGDPALAPEAYRKAIDLAERAGDSLKVAQIANRAASFYRGRASDAARLDFARKAAEAARKADSALDLAQALRASAQTLEEFEQAVAAARRYAEQSGNPQEELTTLNQLAWWHFSRGEYQAAVEVQNRVERPGTRGQGAASRPLSPTALSNSISLYLQAGETALARDAGDRLRQLLDKAGAPAPPRPSELEEVARGYQRLGDLAAQIGDPVAAIEHWNTALAKTVGLPSAVPNQIIRRRVLESRGTLHTQLGDYEAALKDWNDVLPLMGATLRNRTLSEASQKAAWMAALGWTHALAGNLDKALAFARDAMAELRRDTSGQWGQELFDGQTANDRILEILLLTSHPEEAISFFEEQRRKPDLTPGQERILLSLLAKAYGRAKQPDTARALLLAETDFDRKNATGPLMGGLGASLLALGTLELETDNLAEATRHLLAAREAVNPYDVERIWQIERALGLALARTGDLVGAQAHYENALTGLESFRERRRPEEFRLRYGVERSRVYDEFAVLLAARATASRQQHDAQLAFQAVERRRTQELWSLLGAGWSRMPAGTVPDQVRRLLEMDARLAAKGRILRDQLNEPEEKRDQTLLATLARDLSQIQAEHARLLASIAQGRYRYAAPTNLAASLVAPVRAALAPSRVLVEYLVTDQRSYAFVVSQAGVTVVPLAAGRTELRQQVQRLLQPFRQLRAGEVDLARIGYDTDAAYALYRAIFAPLRPALGRASELLIVPDDVLNILPFEALVERAPATAEPAGVMHAQFADEAFLLRRYTISYLTSSAQLLANPPAQGPSQAPRPLFAMANPTAGVAAPAPAQDDPLRRQLRSDGFGRYLAPLPGAETEVQRIARSFAPDAATIVTGGRATESAYASQAGQYGIVHFATHGVASDSQPLYSTLVLAPDAAAGDDGFLQAYEVLRTPLRAELVVLSGCETATGSEEQGQGLVGLAAAFEQAGARSVLATLWSIDEASAEMMTAFYRAMAQGRSTPAALRQAKLQLLEQRLRIGKVELSLAHPFFWAPFKLVGAGARPAGFVSSPTSLATSR